MKILIISQYFYPENFRINDLVYTLKRRGHKVEVLTGKPNYPRGEYFENYSWATPKTEIIRGVKVHRANLILRKKGGGLRLFLNYFSFLFFGLFKIFRLNGEYNKVFVYAPSPITVAFIGIYAAWKFKCKCFLWVHDLWPESVKVAGGIENKFILNIINLMTKIIYRNTAKILVQSPEFKTYLKKQNVDQRKIIYYPYYAEHFYKKQTPKADYKKKFPQGFNLLFAGNIGVAQSFDTIINAIEIIQQHNINVVILGEGRDKERVRQLINEKSLSNRFFFLGSYPPEEMPEYFACADVLMISLKKADIFSYTIPGKLQSYLACGKPIIGSLDGIGRKIIQESKSGYVSDAEDSDFLAGNILKIYNDTDMIKKKFSSNAIRYFQNNFEKSYLIEKLEDIFRDY